MGGNRSIESKGRACAVLLVLIACSGCSWLPTEGGLHREGERVASGRVFWATPIVGKAIFWHGEGDVPNFGLGLQNHWFQNDRVALGIGANVMNFKPPGDDVLGGDLEGRLRYFFAETETLGFFLDLNGGYIQTQEQIPPGGTRGNYTFAFGPGIEMPLGGGKSVLLGYEFHHMSNALGRSSERNPSQNESLMWLGYSLSW